MTFDLSGMIPALATRGAIGGFSLLSAGVSVGVVL